MVGRGQWVVLMSGDAFVTCPSVLCAPFQGQAPPPFWFSFGCCCNSLQEWKPSGLWNLLVVLLGPRRYNGIIRYFSCVYFDGVLYDTLHHSRLFEKVSQLLEVVLSLSAVLQPSFGGWGEEHRGFGGFFQPFFTVAGNSWSEMACSGMYDCSWARLCRALLKVPWLFVCLSFSCTNCCYRLAHALDLRFRNEV